MNFRDLVLSIVIFGLLPVCIWRPWIGIVAWYWLGLMSPHRLTWSYGFNMPYAMLIGGATLVGVLLAKDRKPVPWNGPLTLMAVLLAYFALTTVFAWSVTIAWAEWIKVAKIILMTFVAAMFIYGKERIRVLMLTIVLSLGFYGVKGGVFTIMKGGAHRVEGPENTFIGGNVGLGVGLCMVLPLILCMAKEEQRPWFKHFLYAMAALTFISVIFTYSRGAYLGLATVSVLLLLQMRSKLLAIICVIGAITVGPFLLKDQVIERAELIENYEQDTSANQRLQSWTVAWNVALESPLTGAGFDFENFPDDNRWITYGDRKYDRYLTHSSAAHSIYFQILGQHGFVALGLFLAMLFGTLRGLKRIRTAGRVNPNAAWLGNYAAALRIGFMGYMVSGAFISMAYFDLAYLYIVLLAILARELRQVNATAQPKSRQILSATWPAPVTVSQQQSAFARGPRGQEHT
jgi:putative inorganic carbon (HCO3(-)) transporter